MSQLRATKPGLLVCTAVCVCVFLYLRDPAPEEPMEPAYPAAVECGFYPDELCSALFEGKEAAPQIAKFCKDPRGSQILAHLHTPGNCSRVSQKVRFITRPLSAEEANFSLAYIVTTHKDLAMFVRLLRAIYMPQNVYCIHVDKKAPKKYKSAVQTLVNCFENIFISSKGGGVAHTGFTRLQADVTCMKDLVRSKFQWNYVINLCGDDFPIKTNKEIIRYIRSKWADKNITPGVIHPPNVTSKTRVRHPELTPEGSGHRSPHGRFKDEPPHNLTIYSGSTYYALTRKFVEFVLTDIRARDLLQWCRDTQSPERHYWVTLSRLRDAPGATPDASWEGDIRAIKWRSEEGSVHDGCKGSSLHDKKVTVKQAKKQPQPVFRKQEPTVITRWDDKTGRYVHESCVYGPGDLSWIVRSPSLFASKVDSTDPLVATCLERRHRLQALRQAEVPAEPHWRFQQESHFNTNRSR